MVCGEPCDEGRIGMGARAGGEEGVEVRGGGALKAAVGLVVDGAGEGGEHARGLGRRASSFWRARAAFAAWPPGTRSSPSSHLPTISPLSELAAASRMAWRGSTGVEGAAPPQARTARRSAVSAARRARRARRARLPLGEASGAFATNAGRTGDIEAGLARFFRQREGLIW